MPRLLAYVSLDPSEVSLPQGEVLKLCVEAYALWAVLLGYSLQEPQGSLKEFMPLLIRKLHFYRDKVSVNIDTYSNTFNYNMGSHMINMLNRGLSIAATKSMLDTQMRQNRVIKVGLSDTQGDVLQPPVLSWADMSPVVDLVLTCSAKWIVEIQRGETSFSGLALIGTASQFLENYFQKWKDQRECNDGKFLSEIENVYNSVLTPLLQSEVFSKLLQNVHRHSALCSGMESSASENARNLGSLNAVNLDGSCTPLLLPDSPIPAVAPVLSLLDMLHQLHTSLPSSPTFLVLDNPGIQKYLQRLTSQTLSLRTHWFTRIETKMLVNLISIASRKHSNNSILFHNCSLVVLPCLQKGQEHLVRSLLTSVTCNSANVTDISEVSCQLQNIAMHEYEPLKSPALFQPILAPKQLTEKLVLDIDAIGSQVASVLLDSKSVKQSAVWLRDVPFLIASVTVDTTDSPTVLDEYWTLFPLKRILLEKIIKTTIANDNREKEEGKKSTHTPSEESDQSKPELILEVSRCLQLTYLCLRYRKDSFLRLSCMTGWIRHLSLTFLVANDLFLDHTISSYLQGCIRELFCNRGFTLFNDKLEFPGLGNTFDWYKKLIEQYVAVSYADSTFALMLLLPLQQHCPIAFRSLLWGDLSDCLPLIRLKGSEVENFIPVSQFLEPAELDEELVYKYQSAVATRMITENRTPFLWQVSARYI